METVKKAHKTIANYCIDHKMTVSEFFKQYEAGSLAVKLRKPLATRITEDLFNLIREKCPPKLETELETEQGDGSVPSPLECNNAATTGHRSSTGVKQALANCGALVCSLRMNVELLKLMLAIVLLQSTLVGLRNLTEPLL